MVWKILPYRSDLKDKARQLRNNSTVSEKILWKFLKKKQICGFDFDRQRPIDGFIVDFFCKELLLAIEIDGISHNGHEKDDQLRQRIMEKMGIRFLRFTDKQVRDNAAGVAEAISQWIENDKLQKK